MKSQGWSGPRRRGSPRAWHQDGAHVGRPLHLGGLKIPLNGAIADNEAKADNEAVADNEVQIWHTSSVEANLDGIAT